MFTSVRAEVTSRIRRVRDFIAAVAAEESISASGGVPAPSAWTRDAKGLAFVHLYAVYEWCIDNAVRASIDRIRRHAISCSKVKPEILTLAYHAAFSSIENSRTPQWSTRARLLVDAVSSQTVVDIEPNLFPKDGTHYRVSQVQTIWSLFGVTAAAVPNATTEQTVGELVRHRNEIAHGRVRADEVGRGYTISDLNDRVTVVDEYCLYIVDTLESHVLNHANICRP